MDATTLNDSMFVPQRRLELTGVQIAWDTTGDTPGTPLVLCHGFNGSSHDFALQIGPLSENRRVTAFDHRGHGLSSKLHDVTAYSIELMAADVIAFIEHVHDGPIDLLGHSLGGRIALSVVLERPDLVRSLILMDTFAWPFELPAETADMLKTFLTEFDPANGLPSMSIPGPEDELIVATTTEQWRNRKDELSSQFDPYAMKALGTVLFTGSSASLRSRLGEINCGVTVLCGSLDRLFVKMAPDIASAISGAHLEIIEGAYHSPQLTHATEWRHAVQDHLARHS